MVIRYANQMKFCPLFLHWKRNFKFFISLIQDIVGYDTTKALEWFEKGLECHIGNFPCFADMLRNADYRRRSASEIVRMIDTILSSQSKQTYKVQLNFIKGFFLWLDDKDGTLHSWLLAMKESTDMKINVRLSNIFPLYSSAYAGAGLPFSKFIFLLHSLSRWLHAIFVTSKTEIVAKL